MKALALFGAATMAVTATEPSKATTLLYTLYGQDTTGAYEYSTWYLDSNPVVSSFEKGVSFEVDGIAGNYNYGSQFHSDLNDLTFYHLGAGAYAISGAANLFDLQGIIDIYGPQLYSGPESAPTMLTGLFTTHDYYSGASLKLKVAAVPEIGIWAMMLAGFGAIGYSLRARHQTVRFT